MANPGPFPANPANWVEKFIVEKCWGGFAVTVETAMVADLKLLYSIAEPDIWLVTELVTGHSLGHHGRQHLRKAKKVNPTWVDKGLTHFFTISSLTNFTLFWWMVYESVRDDFIWWSSQIIETQIDCPYIGVHTAYGDQLIWGSPFHVGGNVSPHWITKTGDIAPNFGPQGKVPPGFHFHANFWALIHPLIGKISSGDGKVWWTRADNGSIIGHGSLEVDPTHQQVFFSGSCDWTNPSGETVLVVCHVQFEIQGPIGTLVSKKGECWLTIGEKGVHHYPPSGKHFLTKR